MGLAESAGKEDPTTQPPVSTLSGCLWGRVGACS